MIPWDKVNDLRHRADEFKQQGDFAAMLPLREEVARLLEDYGAAAKEVANGWNYVAYVNRQIGDFPAAERAARKSLAFYVEHSEGRDELLASYLWMLWMTLVDQSRFAEALPYVEEGVGLFAELHGEDDFVIARRADLAKIRGQLRQG
ncbi:hypothetical protein [Haloferula sp. BvORR071]|uniref:hypothetical protein n=1 Tax=Haloferula sp. BvORR071 TaxID=1396141 RepID=UPI0005564E8A|nr:hypothetical protein [Haloferula sp. BvORR071]